MLGKLFTKRTSKPQNTSTGDRGTDGILLGLEDKTPGDKGQPGLPGWPGLLGAKGNCVLLFIIKH